jgi:hypothetical protein
MRSTFTLVRLGVAIIIFFGGIAYSLSMFFSSQQRPSSPVAIAEAAKPCIELVNPGHYRIHLVRNSEFRTCPRPTREEIYRIFSEQHINELVIYIDTDRWEYYTVRTIPK